MDVWRVLSNLPHKRGMLHKPCRLNRRGRLHELDFLKDVGIQGLGRIKTGDEFCRIMGVLSVEDMSEIETFLVSFGLGGGALVDLIANVLEAQPERKDIKQPIGDGTSI